MKRILLAAIVLASLFQAPSAHAVAGPHVASPPGQVYVVTVNANQTKVIGGTAKFQMLVDLAEALVTRPRAFDGGAAKAGAAPDVIVLQELRASNLDMLEKVIRSKSDFRYAAFGSLDSRAKFLINTDRIAVDGEPVLWEDPCFSTMEAATHDPSPDAPERIYQWGRFIEKDTGTPFAVAGVHFSKLYWQTGEERCVERNIEAMRLSLAPVASLPTFIGGDFNRKAVDSPPPCDPEERGNPLEWWSMMTAPEQGTAYGDSVRTWATSGGRPMANQWTHEHKLHHVTCGQTYIRHRLDYMFHANATLAYASADHPGWAGSVPGTRSKTIARYSDHRFIAARYQIAGPERGPRPEATALSGGRIALYWGAEPPAEPENPDEPAASQVAEAPAEWLVYRSIGTKPYSLLARVPGTVVAYEDSATLHGRNYRYAIAAVDSAGAQGLESPPDWMLADARGPRVKGTTPGSGARGVERRQDIFVRFDERVVSSSVHSDTVQLYYDGRKICGRVSQVKNASLMLDPCKALGKKKTYRVAVRPVADGLGNRGESYSWRFTTR